MNGSRTRAGFAAIVGAPNAGKSTLVNALVGSKVSIVSPKVQTTRMRVIGIAMTDLPDASRAQVVLVDTPGIFRIAKRRLERAMVAAAWQGAEDADVVALVVDAERGVGQETRAIAERLKESRAPRYLITANVHYAMLTADDPRLDPVNRGAALVLADGMPLVWAARGRLPERGRTLASPADTSIPRLASGRGRMGNAPAPRRASRCREPSAYPIGPNNRTPDDNRERYGVESGLRHDRRHRSRCSQACRSPGDHRQIPFHDPPESGGRAGTVDRTSAPKPRRLVRKWHRKRRGSGARRNCPAMVEWTQAREAPNVRSGKDRPAPG